MPKYEFYFSNKHHRVKYPRRLALAGTEAARGIAVRLARILIEASPYWGDLSTRTRSGFTVEVVDEAGQTVLIVPFTEAEEPTS
jgi:hypothetical protein